MRTTFPSNLPSRCLLLLAIAASAALLPAQIPAEPLDAIAKRFAAGGDLIEMQWMRDDANRLLTRPKGAEAWQPLLKDDIKESMQATGVAGWLMAWLHGDNDLLGMTDGERHLLRVGVRTADVDLRMFVATPLPADADALHPAVLDRMVAIDLLRRRGVKGAAAELEGVSKRAGVPAALQQRARDALAVLHGTARDAPAVLDPATLPLPVVADGYLVFDNTRMPDTSRLADVGRRLGLASTLAILKKLKAPTVADLTIGQTESDSIGELPFELARRLGNHRVTQGFVAMQWLPQEATPFGLCLQLAGSFDHDTLRKRFVEDAHDNTLEVKPLDDGVTLKSEDGELTLQSARITGSLGTSMRGKPRPEQAKQLLALGDAAIRVVLPAQSKAWLSLAPLGLPAAQGGEVTVAFLPAFVVRVTITARDEDAADKWVERAKALSAEYVPMVEHLLATGEHAAPLADLVAALKAITIKADGKTATAELTGKTLGWATFEALLRSSAGI